MREPSGVCMRIFGIIKGLSFTAGKVHVYSDFDGTYCPARHSSLHKEGANGYMKDYCSKMDSFIKSTKGDLDMHITTGRTFGEFEAISHLLKMRNFYLPLPESFISKNGSDEYIKFGTDNQFYTKGEFPYRYLEPNKLKEEEIKELTNWDGLKLKDFIKNLAKRYNLNFIEADSENSVQDYGNNSLFSEGKLDSDEWKKLPIKDGKIQEHKIPIANFVMGSRKDGNLKVNLIFPPDYGYCPERNYIYDSFMNEIKEFLAVNKINYSMDWDVPSKYNHYRNHCNIVPKINGAGLTKLYDTKKALADAVKNNDIVVVAGDGSNDFEMLNPLEYIEQKDWEIYKKNSKCKYFYDSDMKERLSYIKDAYEGRNDMLKHELETSGLIKQIKEMPFYSIIVKKEKSSLRILSDVFGRFGKVIEIDSGDLDKGIKSAIKKYANESNIFKKSMSEKFIRYVFGGTKKKDNKTLIYSGLALFFAVAGGVTYSYKNNKKLKDENTIN